MLADSVGEALGMNENDARIALESMSVPFEKYSAFVNLCNSLRVLLGDEANHCRNCPMAAIAAISAVAGYKSAKDVEKEVLEAAQECGGAQLIVEEQIGPFYICTQQQ